MESVEVTDLYQASWLILSGCQLTGIQCIPMSGSLGCLMVFTGPRIYEMQEEYFEKRASVNLWAFRSAYNQVNSYIHQAKKSYDQGRRRETGNVAAGSTP
jgi:hypothetical protein